MSEETTTQDKKVTAIDFAEFLASTPPNQKLQIKDLATQESARNDIYYLNRPDIFIFCSSEVCGGDRMFAPVGYIEKLLLNQSKNVFLTYHCRNCRRTFKTFALTVALGNTIKKGSALKLGEAPSFGPLTPSRVITLIGSDRDAFLKGRQCENQGLGIGAFSYYRRVVENQKERLIDSIINVAKKLSAAQSMLNDLQNAKSESQFSTAVESIKHGIPEVLKINGHNPLILLHSALSQGLHAEEDTECLELAQSIRVVITELADRIGIALKDHAELNAAVTKLLSVKQKKSKLKVVGGEETS